jgi:adenosyl cobinamide kinase/adenosyl cobinamide phosphate guanylyltransferase
MKCGCQSCWINRINKHKICMRQNSWKSLEQSECILGILKSWNKKSADTYIRSLKTWAKNRLIME